MADDFGGPDAARVGRGPQTVAARTGYASEFAFAKAFKREFGTAPGQYRRATERR